MNMTAHYCWIVALGIGGALWSPIISAQTAGPEAYQALVKREFGTAMNELAAIEKEVGNAKPDQYPAIEARLLAVLENPEATMAGKQFVCQMLRTAGSAKCVPAVGKLLTDEQLSHSARFVLQEMRDPVVAPALREALGRTQGKLRIGIINTIGDRRDRESLAAVAALLTGNDEATVRAALNALGKIGGLPAAEALEAAKPAEPLKVAWGDAYLRCASSLAGTDAARADRMCRALFEGDYPPSVRAGAFEAMVQAQKAQAVPLILKTLASGEKLLRRAALGAVISVPGNAATRAFAQELAGLAPEAKVMLLKALAARGDADGLTVVVNRLASDGDETVRGAALQALARLGDVSSVPVLAAALKQKELAPTANRALVELQGPGVIEALLQQVETGEAAVRPEVLNILAGRRQAEALPAVRKAVSHEDAKIRQAALKALAVLGTKDDLAVLADMILAKKNEGERDQIASAMADVGSRLTDKSARCEPVLQAWAKADAPTKISLLPVLATLGGDRALQTLRGALGGDAEVKKAAVRALADWPDAAPMADLLNVAKEDKANQVVALRGYLKMLGQSGGKAEAKVSAYREAFTLATRPEEKKLVLAGVADLAQVDALKLVEPCLGDPALQREAFVAYEKIAESLVNRQPAVAREALQRVIDKATDAGLSGKAKKALDKIK